MSSITPTLQTQSKVYVDPKTHQARLIATQQEINSLREAGFLKTKTLTGEAIFHLGKYAKRVFKDENIDTEGNAREVSTSLSVLKIQILAHAQGRLTILAQLEKILNSNSTLEIFTAFNAYQETFKSAHSPECKNFLEGKNVHLAAKIQELLGDEAKSNPRLLNEYMREYIRRQTLAVLAWTSAENRELVGKTGSLNWGDFNNYTEDAIQATKDYKFPLSVQPKFEHDLISANHPNTSPNSKPLIDLDLNDYMDGSTAHDEKELRLMQRYLKYKKEDPDSSGDEGSEISDDKNTKLPRWKSGKWNFLLAYRRLSGPDQDWNNQGLIGNFLTGTLKLAAYTVDSVIGFFSGLILGKSFDKARQAYQRYLHKNDRLTAEAETEQDILNHLERPSFLNKIGMLIHRGARELGGSVQSAMIGITRIFTGIYTELKLSATASTQAEFKKIFEAPKASGPQNQVSTESEEKAPEIQIRNPAWAATAPATPAEVAIAEPLKIKINTPLDPYKTDDLLGLAVNGTKSFFDLFAHNIYAKHPTLGLIFTASYAMGLLPLIAPHLAVKLFGSHYTHLIQILKETTDKGESMLAKAGVSFLTAKIQTAALELISDGPNSWTVKGIDNFRKDPATISAILVAAYFGGHFFINGSFHGHQLPGAETLGKETGTIPEFAETLIGAKLFGIIYGMLSRHDAHAPKTISQTEIQEAITQAKAEVSREIKHLSETQKILLENFHQLPKLSWRKKAIICDQVGAEYGYNSELARTVRAKCNEKQKSSYFGKSIQHLLDYVGVLARLPIALIATPLRLIFMKNKQEATRPLRRLAVKLSDLLIDSYARVMTNALRLTSLIANIVVQRAPRVFGGIALKIRTLGSAMITWKRLLFRKLFDSKVTSKVDHHKIKTYATRSMALHQLGEAASYQAQAVTGVLAAQEHSQPGTHITKLAQVFGPQNAAAPDTNSSKSRAGSVVSEFTNITDGSTAMGSDVAGSNNNPSVPPDLLTRRGRRDSLLVLTSRAYPTNQPTPRSRKNSVMDESESKTQD